MEDDENFLFSSNVQSLAVEKGLWDPESGTPFNWKRAYSPAEGSAASTQARRGRMWRFFDLVAPSREFSAEIPNMGFPFSVQPDEKLSLKRVIALMRDKYQGSEYDPAGGLRGGPFANPNYYKGFRVDGERYLGPRCISVNNVEYTSVAVCRDWLPDSIGGVVWLAFGAQDTSCYMPLYAGVTRIPRSFSIGDHWKFDRESARWAFDYTDFHTQVAYSPAIKDVQAAQAEWEDGAIDRTPAMDAAARALYEQDPALARQFITDYCNNNADKVVEAWWKLGDDLLVKYNHLRGYDAEKRKTRSLEFPDWWQKAVVEHDGLKPLERKKK